MKITDSRVIRDGENELIDAITAEIDWGAIEEIFKKEHRLGIEEDVEYKRGDIVVHENAVAYKLEFQVNVTLSVLLDREGRCISVSSSGDLEGDEGETDGEVLDEPEVLDNVQEVQPDLQPSDTSDNDEGESQDDGETGPLEEAGEDHKLPEESEASEPEDGDISPDVSAGENPDENISQMVSEAGEIIAEMNRESSSPS